MYTITFTDKATGERAADPRKADSGIAAKLTVRWFARTRSQPFTTEVIDDNTGEVAIYYDSEEGWY